MTQQGATWHYKKSITDFLASAQNKTYTMLGLTFIALIVFGAFAIRPTISTIVKLNKKVAEGQALDAQMQTKIDALYSLQGKIYANEEELNLSESAFPEDPKIDVIIANAELVAQKYDLRLLSLNPGDESDIDEFYTFSPGIVLQSMRLTLRGNRENFYKFLGHMETLPREVYIIKLSVSEDEEDGPEDNSFTTEILYFYHGE